MSQELKSGVRHKQMIVWQMADKLDIYTASNIGWNSKV